MIAKIVVLFLVFMAVLAMFGRLRFPSAPKKSVKCRRCGRPAIGKGQCPCKKDPRT